MPNYSLIMNAKKIKRYTVLGVLFILPVVFLLMLIPAKHNYTTLDIVNDGISELAFTSTDSGEELKFAEHITVLGFIGKNPMKNAIAISNLKELIYDKFRGFKRFQVVLVAAEGAESDVEILKRELIDYNTMEYFRFAYAKPAAILGLYNSLKANAALDSDMSTLEVFILDKELNQRGRIKDVKAKGDSGNAPDGSLASYNTIEVAEIKNKMSEDMRVLFTEYRQKRKGDFNSTIRRAEDISENNGK